MGQSFREKTIIARLESDIDITDRSFITEIFSRVQPSNPIKIEIDRVTRMNDPSYLNVIGNISPICSGKNERT